MCPSKFAPVEGGDCIMTHAIDKNNFKALAIVSLAIMALENGCDDFDVVSALEVIRDYLTTNNKLFDGLA